MSALLAHLAPARGASLEDIVFASIAGALIVGVVGLIAFLYVKGRFPALTRLASFAEHVSGLPAWASIPFFIAGLSLISAVFGFYWDVSWHIDRGRDPGPFANPAHWFIFVGLCGLAIAGVASVLLGAERPSPNSIRIGRTLRAPVGGVLLLITGGVALAGFPLDDVWHRLFGQDVTLWGPTHIQMIAGASLAALALFVLETEAKRTVGTVAESRLLRMRSIVGVAGLLVGLSTLQAEFDFGVPQFRQLYHPVLIMLAAGIGLVAIRIRGGPGSAMFAALGFLAIRAALTLGISVGLGRSLLHFPLYLVEAGLVELVAWKVPKDRPVRMALWSGILIGTVGLAAEWGWSHVWMPLPWHLSLLPEAVLLGLVAAIGGSLIGALIGRAVSDEPVRSARIPAGVVVVAWLVALLVIAYPAPITANEDHRVSVELQTVRETSRVRWVDATIRLDPPDAADDANWFTVTAWQGAGGTDGGLVISDLDPAGRGIFQTDRPVPVGGQWKTLIRLQTGDALDVAPIYMPADPAIPAPEVPARASFTRHFQPDKQVLQREAVGGSLALQRIAYMMLGALAAAWLCGFGWGFRRLRLGERFDAGREAPPRARTRPARRPAGARCG